MKFFSYLSLDYIDQQLIIIKGYNIVNMPINSILCKKITYIMTQNPTKIL